MSNTSLSPELAKLTSELAEAFASSQAVVAAKASIGLFYQNAEATDLFRKVNEFGEELRNKSMAGMAPSEAEIGEFDALRQQVVENELCKGFLDSRMKLDELLGTVNQYLCLAIDLGHAPSDEEVAAAMSQQVSGGCGCGCSGDNCDGCEGDCDCDGDCKNGGECNCK